jgi:hypothetical protein
VLNTVTPLIPQLTHTVLLAIPSVHHVLVDSEPSAKPVSMAGIWMETRVNSVTQLVHYAMDQTLHNVLDVKTTTTE